MSNIYFVYELKLLMTAYKRILAGISFLAVFCVLMAALAAALPKDTLFSPFTIGVVDKENTAEITLLLGMLNNHEVLNKAVSFEVMTEAEASSRLLEAGIPAYVVVTPGFTQGVITGENPPLILMCNESRVIHSSVARLLVSAGIAFLTTSQSGIYSALNYAYDSGMEDINSIVMPLNIEYIKALIAYNDYFTKNQVTATDDIPWYYTNSVFIFLANIFLISLMGPLFDSTAPQAMGRYYMCGIGLFKVLLVKWAALWLLISALFAPAFFFYGLNILALAAFLSGLGIMCSQLFTGEPAAGLFIFSFAALMMFAAGGILPLAYLPEVFGILGMLTPNYWFIRVGSPLMPAVFFGYGVLFLGIGFMAAKGRWRG